MGAQGQRRLGEFSPFAEYGPAECARWLAAARDAGFSVVTPSCRCGPAHPRGTSSSGPRAGAVARRGDFRRPGRLLRADAAADVLGAPPPVDCTLLDPPSSPSTWPGSPSITAGPSRCAVEHTGDNLTGEGEGDDAYGRPAYLDVALVMALWPVVQPEPQSAPLVGALAPRSGQSGLCSAVPPLRLRPAGQPVPPSWTFQPSGADSGEPPVQRGVVEGAARGRCRGRRWVSWEISPG
ncbi:hypothetical protein LUW74_05360 [Actinomadura madurae]|uniref:hypothetical protein n=1 Tax=Actinomadura madurae TaxID=1993 RepID=UPI0020267BF5|nr:hypothetical protein [Actinomadura madurae]URN10501.1 hypothetical protein LUW74_05360 [Actinomadura madurae]